MTFGLLALLVVAGLAGPVLALPGRWALPVVLGELLAGVVLGPTVADVVPVHDRTLTFLADIGFALVMFVAGSRVPVGDPHLRGGVRLGLVRAMAVGVAATVLAVVVDVVFGTGHIGLYAVLMASSSAALVMPIVDSLRLTGPAILQAIPQVAIADAACIIALPLAIQPSRAGRAALGALAVCACAVAVFVALRWFERKGLRVRMHRVSERRAFALELRIQLAILFALAALAVWSHVSIMLAGFTFGLAVAAVGEPRRLARQLFALTEGFFAPLFFVWLGASLDLRALWHHPSYIALGLALGGGAVAAHLVTVVSGQPAGIGLLSAAQLGVPIAATALGGRLGILRPAEAPAILLGALVTIAASVLAGSRLGLLAQHRPGAG
jgi:Kef-type K+ transport system membrane component KefB